MKKIFSYWVLCLMAFATSALVSCSSDDNGDEWGGFKFENVHDGKLSVAANQTSSEIIMKASKAYRAYVSATSDDRLQKKSVGCIMKALALMTEPVTSISVLTRTIQGKAVLHTLL